MIDNGLAMHPKPTDLVNVYDQNFNGLGATVELFARHYSDEKITRSKGKEVFTFQAMSSSAIYQHLKSENLIEFGGRWFRIKYVEDDEGIKGLTKFTCYALWYELSEGLPSPLSVAASTLSQVAGQIVEPFGKWVKVVIPDSAAGKYVRGVTLKENSALYKLRYLAKQYNLELTFGYEQVIEGELRYIKTVIFLQPYTERKIEFPLVIEHNLKHVTRTEDSRSMVTAYKLTGKAENEGEEFTFASINGGSPYLVNTLWFTSRQMKPRIIPKTKQDDRFTVKQNMLDAARAYLDIYSKPLIGYEANAVLYDQIPDLHHTQLIIDDDYQITEWRRVTSRSIDYDDLTNSRIVFEDPRQDLMDLLNDDGDGALSYESHEQARTVVRFAQGPNGENMNAESGTYIGVITTTRPISSLTPQDFSWVKVKGDDGISGTSFLTFRTNYKYGTNSIISYSSPNYVGRWAVLGSTENAKIGDTVHIQVFNTDTNQDEYIVTEVQAVHSGALTLKSYGRLRSGRDGVDGNDGVPGKDGVGITDTAISYFLSNSGSVTPTSGWTETVPTLVKGKYLWTRTVWRYSDGSQETGYNVSYIAQDGNNGTDGVPGKDGVGIARTVITYAPSTSGTTAPSSGWQNHIPTVTAGQFLWTRTVWHYTDGKSETGYSVSKVGEKGDKGDPGDRGRDGVAGAPGVGIRSTTITYGLSASESVQPTSWSSSVPTLVKGQYLWTKTVWTYTNNTSETGYSKNYIARDGNNGTDGVAGKDGVGIRSTGITYAGSTNGTTAPTSGWSSSVPSVPEGQFLWTKTVWTYTDNTSETGYSVSKMGQRGPKGDPGNVGVVEISLDNLLLNTDKMRDFNIQNTVGGNPSQIFSYDDADDSVVITSRGQTVNRWWGVSWDMSIQSIKQGEKFAIRLPIYRDTSVPHNSRMAVTVKNHLRNDTLWSYSLENSSENQWHIHEIVFTASRDMELSGYGFYVYVQQSGKLKIGRPFMARGNIVPKTWINSRLDIENALANKADNFQANLLREEMNLLKAEVLAKAAEETVREWIKNYQERIANQEKLSRESEAALIDSWRRLTALETHFGGLSELKTFIDTYMTSSNEGLVLGKTDGSTAVKVSADRISMFSAGREVMYISNGVIHINNGIFSTSVQIGKFVEEQYAKNPDINVKRFVG